MHELVKQGGTHNFCGARIPVKSGLNIRFLREKLKDFHNYEIVDYCEFGWPVGNVGVPRALGRMVENHKSAVEFPEEMNQYIKKERERGTLIGPFKKNPFSDNLCVRWKIFAGI